MAKILIVDDSEHVRNITSKMLKEGGHAYVTAVNGVDGLSKLHNNTDIDIILCDVNMPEMDGLTMVSKLECDTPVIMVTTETSIDMKIKAKSNGVIAWATKPFNNNKLLGAIDKILKRGIRSRR